MLAEWFLAEGLRPGERVAVHWSNSFEVVQIYFALFKAGLIAVAVNVRLKRTEIGYIFDHSMARKWFSEPSLGPQAERSGARPHYDNFGQNGHALHRQPEGDKQMAISALAIILTPREPPRTPKA